MFLKGYFSDETPTFNLFLILNFCILFQVIILFNEFYLVN